MVTLVVVLALPWQGAHPRPQARGHHQLLRYPSRMDYIPEPTHGDIESHLIEQHDRDPSVTQDASLEALVEEHINDHGYLKPGHTHAPEAVVMSEIEQRDEMENNLLVAGGVLMALMGYPSLGKVETVANDEGQPTNEMIIHPVWMKSPYKIIIERVPE